MAWYSDEEYELRQDNIDRSITARSARRTRTHNGKGGPVKFPSDYLTPKERKAMNGECVSFELGKPMSWERFKAMPRDLQINYIKMIRERFGATDGAIAEMFGKTGRTLSLYLEDLRLRHPHSGGKRKWDKEKFEAWCRGEEIIEEPIVVNTPVEPVEAVEAENAITETRDISGAEPVEGDTEDRQNNAHIIPDEGELKFTAPAYQALEMVRPILGNAKVVLTVSWTVVKEE